MIETRDIYSFGVENKTVEARLTIEENSFTMLDWDESKSGGISIIINPKFPVQEIVNKYYSIDDYLTTIGGQLSVILGFVAFFASKFLYLSVTKNLGDKLKKEEIMEAVELKSHELLIKNMNEQEKKSALVNAYLNWLSILKTAIKTQKQDKEIENLVERLKKQD